jgi:hypothetical protein
MTAQNNTKKERRPGGRRWNCRECAKKKRKRRKGAKCTLFDRELNKRNVIKTKSKGLVKCWRIINKKGED